MSGRLGPCLLAWGSSPAWHPCLGSASLGFEPCVAYRGREPMRRGAGHTLAPPRRAAGCLSALRSALHSALHVHWRHTCAPPRRAVGCLAINVQGWSQGEAGTRLQSKGCEGRLQSKGCVVRLWGWGWGDPVLSCLSPQSPISPPILPRRCTLLSGYTSDLAEEIIPKGVYLRSCRGDYTTKGYTSDLAEEIVLGLPVARQVDDVRRGVDGR